MKRDNGCSDEQLTLYHYGELDPTEHLQLEAHLAACPACRDALTELQASLAVVPRAGLQLNAAQRLQFAERVVARTRRGHPRGLPVWGGALVAAGIFGVSIMLVTPDDRGVPAQTDLLVRTDFELVEQFELLQDLTLLQELDLLQELESL